MRRRGNGKSRYPYRLAGAVMNKVAINGDPSNRFESGAAGMHT